MVSPQLPEILELVNSRKNRALLIAESSLPASQYAAYRKLFLNEFGEKGLESDLKSLFKNSRERHGAGGNRLGRKGGYYDG